MKEKRIKLFCDGCNKKTIFAEHICESCGHIYDFGRELYTPKVKSSEYFQQEKTYPKTFFFILIPLYALYLAILTFYFNLGLSAEFGFGSFDTLITLILHIILPSTIVFTVHYFFYRDYFDMPLHEHILYAPLYACLLWNAVVIGGIVIGFALFIIYTTFFE